MRNNSTLISLPAKAVMVDIEKIFFIVYQTMANKIRFSAVCNSLNNAINKQINK